MKKIFSGSIIFVLIFSFGAIVFAQDVQSEPILPRATVASNDNPEGLQKILSPDQVKNFKNIKKIGNSLFGILKIKKEQKQEEKKQQALAVLEKIANPNEIKFFEKIRKVGPALWGYKKAEFRKMILVKPEAVQCVKDAIDKKDLAVKASIVERSEKMQAAVDARNACQKTAIEKTIAQEQNDANKICVDAFRKAMLEADKSAEKTKNDSWKSYISDMKNCSALQNTDTASSGENIIEEISIEDGESST